MREKASHIALLCLFCALPVLMYGQLDNLRTKRLPVAGDTLLLDSLSIVAESVRIELPEGYTYEVDAAKGWVVFSAIPPLDSLDVSYRVLPLRLQGTVSHKDSSLWMPVGSTSIETYIYRPTEASPSVLETDALQKSGYISRGVTAGNSQNLGLNSSLNLQLSGKLTEKVSVLATVTDNNIPIQADGNTAQLQDFDKVFIQLYNDDFKMIAGDFQLARPPGHFLNYYKRGQGLNINTTHALAPLLPWEKGSAKLNTQASVAFSKGKFARDSIQGVEANQGPYKLQGNNREAYIVVLSGTERVYIDGQLKERGQSYDYIIDYNTAEITFTSNQLITKDRRIVVEFQYTDQSYARSMIQGSVSYDSDTWTGYVNYYDEQDNKNQPLQQDLTQEQRMQLVEAGNDPLKSIASGIDSVGYNKDVNLYALIDSLGFDSVYVFSSHPDSAFYQLRFSYVGAGNGDYLQDGFTPFGRKFKWVLPDSIGQQIVHNGDYAPVILLATPKKNKMFVTGAKYAFNKHIKLGFESAFSERDLNTFSALDNDQNKGLAMRANLESTWNLSQKHPGLKMDILGNYEHLDANFQAIERYRDVEFERDWNLQGEHIGKVQDLRGGSVALKDGSRGKLSIGMDNFVAGTYSGLRSKADVNWRQGPVRVDALITKVDSRSKIQSSFVRHFSNVSYGFPVFRVGFADEREENLRQNGARDTLFSNSYSYYDWQAYIEQPDSIENKYKIFYRERSDKKAYHGDLGPVSLAKEYGLSASWLSNRTQQFIVNVRQRRLQIVDSLYTQAPENTILMRMEHRLRLNKSWLSSQIFYEVGSGLEQQREYIYIEVGAGQGNFVWIDNNDNGIKELEEFQPAAFAYDGNYLKIYVPSSNYVKVYSNQFSQSLAIDPSRLWTKNQGLTGFLRKFYNQTSYKQDRKTTREEGVSRFNPFVGSIPEQDIVAVNSAFRNTLFYQRSSAVFGAEYNYNSTFGKLLLSNGYESRRDWSQGLRLRWGITEMLTMVWESRYGNGGVSSNYLNGRNYRLEYQKHLPELIWQPSAEWQLSTLGALSKKDNVQDEGGESSLSRTLGVKAVYREVSKGSVEFELKRVFVEYNGALNNALSYEMLEGLSKGTNYTWEFRVQRTLSRNLQLNLLYQGRKPGDLPSIHSGSAQIRAFF